MEAIQIDAIEAELNRLARRLPYIHIIWGTVLLLIGCLKPPYMNEMILAVSLVGLFGTTLINKVYIQKGKELEKYKTFNPSEATFRKQEYVFKFAIPRVFWLACVICAMSW